MKTIVIPVYIENLQTIRTLLGLYLTELNTVASPNDAIKAEVRRASTAVNILDAQYLDDDNFSLAEVYLDADIWGLILTASVKYIQAKRQKLATMKSIERVKGSTEQEEQSINNLEGLMQKFINFDIPDHELLVDNFMPLLPSDGELADKASIQIQVGDVYGQVNVGNQGTISQSNTYNDVNDALNKLADAVKEAVDLSVKQKSDAIGDIQSIQAQLTKAEPDKGIVKKLLSSLSVLADTAQVGQVAVTLAPHVHSIQHLLSNIH